MGELLEKTDMPARRNLPATPKGVIDPVGAAARISLRRYEPAAALRAAIEYFWVVEWNLETAAAQVQRVLPYPNAHLVFEPGRTAIHGVVRSTFERRVEGAGLVLGVRFHPGGLRPFIDRPMSALTDRTMPVDDVLGMSALQAERHVLAHADDGAMIAAAEGLLTACLPAVDPRVALAGRAVTAAAAENGPISVAALCTRVEIEERALQRLFSAYVGVSPKWVIQRFRLQEAIWRMSKDTRIEIADLALELGFYDQAHFTRQFTRLIGCTPHEYKKLQTPAQV